MFNRSEQTLISKSTNIVRCIKMCLNLFKSWNVFTKYIIYIVVASNLEIILRTPKTRNAHIIIEFSFGGVCTYNNRRIYIEFELCAIKEVRTYIIYIHVVKQRLVLLGILNFWLVLFAKGASSAHTHAHTLRTAHGGNRLSRKISTALST